MRWDGSVDPGRVGPPGEVEPRGTEDGTDGTGVEVQVAEHDRGQRARLVGRHEVRGEEAQLSQGRLVVVLEVGDDGADPADGDLDLGDDGDPGLGSPAGRASSTVVDDTMGAVDQQRVAVQAAGTEGARGGEHPVGLACRPHGRRGRSRRGATTC